jgi:hypothetical protein
MLCATTDAATCTDETNAKKKEYTTAKKIMKLAGMLCATSSSERDTAF